MTNIGSVRVSVALTSRHAADIHNRHSAVKPCSSKSADIHGLVASSMVGGCA